MHHAAFLQHEDLDVVESGRHVGGEVQAGAEELAAEERSEEHTSELQSLMRTSYAVFCWKKQNRPRPACRSRLPRQARRHTARPPVSTPATTEPTEMTLRIEQKK